MKRKQAIAELMKFYPYKETDSEVESWRKLPIDDFRKVYVYLMYVNAEEAEQLIITEDDANVG